MGSSQQREFEPGMENVVCGNGYYGRSVFGVSAKNAKKNIEDAFSVKMHKNILLLGVFDGHCGYEAAKYCRDYMFDFMVQKYKDDTNYFSNDRSISDSFLEFDVKMEEYWKRASPKVQSHIKQRSETGERVDGCCPGATATIAIIIENDDHSEVVFINLGDSMGSVSEMLYMNEKITYDSLKKDREVQQEDLYTMHHKPKYEPERKRVEKAGGNIVGQMGVQYVTQKDRNKMVQMTRVFGDFELKNTGGVAREKQVLLPHPFIRRKKFFYRNNDEENGDVFLSKRGKVLISLYTDGAARLRFSGWNVEKNHTVFEMYVHDTLKRMVEVRTNMRNGESLSVSKMVDIAKNVFEDRGGASNVIREGVVKVRKRLNSCISFPKEWNANGNKSQEMPLLGAIANEIIVHAFCKKETRVDYCDDATVILAILDISKH